MKKKLLLFLLIMGISSLAQAIPEGPEAVMKSVEPIQNIGNQVDLDLEFRDSSGAKVKLGKYFTDKPVFLIPVYYECPMLCGLVMDGFLAAINKLKLTVGEDYNVVVYSVDPGETPELAAEKKNKYTRLYKARHLRGAGWAFLTGTDEANRALTKDIGFKFIYDPETDEYIHAAYMAVLDGNGVVNRYFSGISFVPRDFNLALVETSQNKLGGFIDKILLYCYHYDPATGTYGFMITNVLRVAGVITVVLLAFFMLKFLREDKNKKI